MPADEVTHGTDVEASRVRTGPRHAAPKKPLFTRFHMPAGKAIAMAAMPTAVLMGMGFTSTLALADSAGSTPAPAKSLSAEEYKDCVASLDGSSASPSPSASASASESAGDDASATPSPSATSGSSGSSDSSQGEESGDDSGGGDGKESSGSGGSSSSDSGSDDKATPTPSPSESASPSASASAGAGGLLGAIGDAVTGILTGGAGKTPEASATPSASASASESKDADESESAGKDVSGTVEDTVGKVTDKAEGATKDTAEKAGEAAKDTTDAVGKATDEAASSTPSAPTPSPSASASDDANCPAATDDEGGVDNKVPVSDDPWHLDASSLLLKSADYQGVVEVRTASGVKKKVLKYVISGGTDIGDLHQTVLDSQSGKTYHVQAAAGSTSTIRNGDTTMYTESISGNLFGLIPVTFSPDSPPPLNIPLIYFTNAKVIQAAQFGGELHVPGLHQYSTG